MILLAFLEVTKLTPSGWRVYDLAFVISYASLYFTYAHNRESMLFSKIKH